MQGLDWNLNKWIELINRICWNAIVRSYSKWQFGSSFRVCLFGVCICLINSLYIPWSNIILLTSDELQLFKIFIAEIMPRNLFLGVNIKNFGKISIEIKLINP